MSSAEPKPERREPRFTLGAPITVAWLRSQKWREVPAVTVNVSEHGVLVSMREVPLVGETVRIRVHAPAEFVGEAVVRRVVRGTASVLVGMRLLEKHGVWLAPAG